jgi:hypothetical protein
MSDTSNRDTRRGRPRPMHRRDDGHQRDNDNRGNDSRGNTRERNGDTSIDRELLSPVTMRRTATSTLPNCNG